MCRNIVLPDKTTLETVGHARQHFKHFPDSLFSYNPGVTPSDDSCLCNLNVTELAKLNGFTATPDAFDWIFKPMTNQFKNGWASGSMVCLKCNKTFANVRFRYSCHDKVEGDWPKCCNQLASFCNDWKDESLPPPATPSSDPPIQ